MTSRYRLGRRLWLFGLALVVLLVIGIAIQWIANPEPGGLLGA